MVMYDRLADFLLGLDLGLLFAILTKFFVEGERG